MSFGEKIGKVEEKKKRWTVLKKNKERGKKRKRGKEKKKMGRKRVK
jgi:hypothetical protein